MLYRYIQLFTKNIFGTILSQRKDTEDIFDLQSGIAKAYNKGRVTIFLQFFV